jgi:hypothetical protein
LTTDRLALESRLHPGLGREQARDDRAVQEHRALCDTGGTTGVLQHCDITRLDRHRSQLSPCAISQRGVESHRTRQHVGRDHFPDPAQREIDDGAFRESKHFPHRGDDHMLDGRLGDHLLGGRGEVLDHDQRACAGVLQLVLQFPRRVQRIDIDDDRSGAKHGGHGDRVLQHVRQHDRDAIALGDAPRLQVCRKLGGQPVDVAEADRPAHQHVGRLIAIVVERLLHQCNQGRIALGIDARRHPLRIVLEPDLFHGAPVCLEEADYCPGGRRNASRRIIERIAARSAAYASGIYRAAPIPMPPRDRPRAG